MRTIAQSIGMVAGFWLILGGAALAQNPNRPLPPAPRSISLGEALALAKAQNIDAILARERVQQAIERLGQSISPLLPRITGAASQSRQTRNLESLGISLSSEGPVVGPFNTFDARVSVTQTIFDMTVIQRLRAAAAGKDQSLAERRKTGQDVLALIANLYIEADRAEDSVQFTKSVVARDRKGLSLEKRRLEIGTGSDLSVKRAEADLSESRWALESARSAAVERRIDLAVALGLSPGQPIGFAKGKLFEDPALPTVAEIQASKETHPEVEAARELLRVREAERWAELAEFLPKVSGFGDYGLSGETPSNSEVTYTVGAKVTLSLFEGGATIFRANEAESRIRESQASIDDLERRVEANVLISIESIKSALTAVNAREAQLVVSTKERSLARQRFDSGIGSELDVLDAVAQESQARDQKREAVALYWLAQVQMLHSLGHMDRLGAAP